MTFPYVLECDSLVIMETARYHYMQHDQSQCRGKFFGKDVEQFRQLFHLVSQCIKKVADNQYHVRCKLCPSFDERMARTSPNQIFYYGDK